MDGAISPEAYSEQVPNSPLSLLLGKGIPTVFPWSGLQNWAVFTDFSQGCAHCVSLV